MKRAYTKPSIQVELFTTDRTIAAGECNRIQTGTETSYTYSPQTVNCIVSGSETIFNSGNSGCTNPVIVGAQGSSWYFKNYDGVDYFVWYDGQTSGQPNATQKAVLDGCGINKPGWHAATYTVTESIKQLFGFSY